MKLGSISLPHISILTHIQRVRVMAAISGAFLKSLTSSSEHRLSLFKQCNPICRNLGSFYPHHSVTPSHSILLRSFTSSALRSRASFSSSSLRQPWVWGNLNQRSLFSSLTFDKDGKTEILKLEEVEKVLYEIRADDVKVIHVGDNCDLTDYMVFATGRSSWHVRNIAQALVYKAKQKQKEAKRMLLPSVEGEESGNWIVVDSGSVIVHALDEKARAYYNLEGHWAGEKQPTDTSQELNKATVKVRRKNNSKKRVQTNA